MIFHNLRGFKNGLMLFVSLKYHLSICKWLAYCNSGENDWQ